MAQTRNRTTGREPDAVRSLTGEFHDSSLEARYWSFTQDDLAHWAATAATLCGAFSIPLALADLANVGWGVAFLSLLVLRAMLACVSFGLARLLRSEPATITRHGFISAACAALVVGFALIALMQPDSAQLDHLEVGLILMGVLVLVPNRVPYALGVCGSAAALWVAASAAVRHSPDAAVVAHSLGFATTIAIGWAAASLLGATRRRAFAEHVAAERANEQLRAEITRRERMERELVSRANLDPLTKIPNRRHFEEQAQDEFVRCQRTHQPMSLLLLDVDHFKWINDTHGHAAGDEVLRVFSDALAEQVRRIDVVGRLGGEAFAVVMPGADRERAEEAAERLRARVAGLRIDMPTGLVRLTVSIGVTECDVWTEHLAEALARADVAMYQAKTSGRDQVVFA
ncbi:MAG: GGDEF domain-containing protein [Microthrixaceae bacterium]|nr:GGDEF domain-containing protein [Microthrixaceae bacterium]